MNESDKNNGPEIPGEKLAERVSPPAWFPNKASEAPIHRHLAPAAEEYVLLQRAVEKLLAEMDPVQLHRYGVMIDGKEKVYDVKMEAVQAELAGLAEELANKLVAVRGLIQSVLTQKPGPDLGHVNETFTSSLKNVTEKFSEGTRLVDRIRPLRDQAKKAFASCKTVNECVAVANKLAENGIDFLFSQCPEGWAQKYNRDGVHLQMVNSRGERNARTLDQGDIDSACLRTVKTKGGEIKILYFIECDIDKGILLYSGINLAIITRETARYAGPWNQSSGSQKQSPQYSKINRKA